MTMRGVPQNDHPLGELAPQPPMGEGRQDRGIVKRPAMVEHDRYTPWRQRCDDSVGEWLKVMGA
jgi:hypothetical protein